jgi:exodeoxyribonuclease VII large subunit
MLRWIQEKQQRLDDLGERLTGGSRRLLTRRSEALASLAERLGSLDPRRILSRGYSVTQVLPGDRALTRAADAPAGTKLKTTLAEGEVISTVDED